MILREIRISLMQKMAENRSYATLYYFANLERVNFIENFKVQIIISLKSNREEK